MELRCLSLEHRRMHRQTGGRAGRQAGRAVFGGGRGGDGCENPCLLWACGLRARVQHMTLTCHMCVGMNVWCNTDTGGA